MRLPRFQSERSRFTQWRTGQSLRKRIALPFLLASTLLAACAPATSETASTTSLPSVTSTQPSAATVPRAVEIHPTAGSSPLRPQPADVPYPADTWPVGPWPDEVDRETIEDAIAEAMGDGIGPRVRAVIIVHRGAIVHESYGAEDGRDTVFPSFSVAKSIAALAVGIAVGDGLLDPAAPAPVAEWQAPGDHRATITLDDLLRMTSGLRWREQDQRGVDLLALLAAEDTAAYTATRPLESTPGTVFTYSTGTSSIVARLLGEVVGGNVEEFLRSRLFGPIGADVELRLDDAGTWLAGLAADTTARGYARLGLLVLRDGVWDGAQILPEGWVDRLRTPTPVEPTYGAHWRLDPDRPGVLFARGLRGQIIAVDPGADLVVVQTATDRATSERLNELILGAFTAR